MKERGSVSLWLMPARAESGILREIVLSVARECGTPMFEPHLTVASGIRGQRMALAARVKPIATSCKRIALRVSGVGLTDEYFRSLFLSVRNSAALEKLRQALLGATGTQDERPLDPHVSLAYGTITPAEKQRIIQKHAPSFPASISFDRLAIVRASTAIDVQRWRVLQTLPIGNTRPSKASGRRHLT